MLEENYQLVVGNTIYDTFVSREYSRFPNETAFSPDDFGEYEIIHADVAT